MHCVVFCEGCPPTCLFSIMLCNTRICWSVSTKTLLTTQPSPAYINLFAGRLKKRLLPTLSKLYQPLLARSGLLGDCRHIKKKINYTPTPYRRDPLPSPTQETLMAEAMQRQVLDLSHEGCVHDVQVWRERKKAYRQSSKS